MKLSEKNALETLMNLNPKNVEIVRFLLYDHKVLPWTFVYCSRPIIKSFSHISVAKFSGEIPSRTKCFIVETSPSHFFRVLI